MKVLFINKKQKTRTWSDAIGNLKVDLGELPGLQVVGFEIDTSSLSKYLNNAERLESFIGEKEFDIILVHHVICAWPIIPVLKNQRALKLLALHEAEPVLGYAFLIKNIFRIPVKSWIRFLRFWNSYPIRFFDRVLILNRHQAIFKKIMAKYHQLDFLGVDEENFREGQIPKLPLKGFFPFGKDRIEKGFHIAQMAVEDQKFEVSLKQGGGIPFSEIPTFYRNSHFLILPTLFETYSLVLLEAMASNIFILASKSIGLIDKLLLKYSQEDLASYGIFVCERTIASFSTAIGKVHKQVEGGKKARTRELLLLEGLNRQGVAKKLAEVLLLFRRANEVD